VGRIADSAPKSRDRVRAGKDNRGVRGDNTKGKSLPGKKFPKERERAHLSRGTRRTDRRT